ncbi:RpiB/LacA/LacB family sugar-phosphate isomerase [Patescibacteria group bacterium]|nr:RpiB/LacA/LacB family sugar-phosphate isomerase [Patescibacteria group bacterium]
MNQTVFLAADHAGFDIKNILAEHLRFNQIDFDDLGAFTLNPDDDYTQYASMLSEAVVEKPNSLGILVCGSAEGVCIAANKFHGIRAGIGYSVEAAASMRSDEDANVLCLPGRLNIQDDPIKIMETFLSTPFSNQSRHKRRLKHIQQIESNT